MKYTLECSRWNKNGDHWADGDVSKEGAVVRYYRHPETKGEQLCPFCGVRMHDHGWIDSGGDGRVVCPGDVVISNGTSYYACDAEVFAALFPSSEIDRSKHFVISFGVNDDNPKREAVDNIKRPYIERVLGLPAGTVRKWTTAQETPEDRALRRIIERFPWMLDVADNNFDPTTARAAVLRAASEIVDKMPSTDIVATLAELKEQVDELAQLVDERQARGR